MNRWHDDVRLVVAAQEPLTARSWLVGAVPARVVGATTLILPHREII